MRFGCRQYQWRAVASIPNDPSSRQRQIPSDKVLPASNKTPSNIEFCHVMATHRHTCLNTTNCQFRIWEDEIMNLQFVADRQRLAQQVDVGSSAQRAFKRKTLAALDIMAKLIQQNSSCGEQLSRRIEWREAARDLVRVQKSQTVQLGGQKLFRECGFASAIAAADQIDCARFVAHRRRLHLIASRRGRAIFDRATSLNSDARGEGVNIALNLGPVCLEKEAFDHDCFPVCGGQKIHVINQNVFVFG